MNIDTEASILSAADWIREADVILFSTGAGMGVDSGLKVYNDVADIEPYRKKNLTYDELSRPEWLKPGRPAEDVATFFGWWGSCFNDYRKTEPHRGYDIVAKWRNAVEKRTANRLPGKISPFFSFTSNVDHHSIVSGLCTPQQCDEIHGNVEFWQCRDDCSDKVWRAPPYYRFNVDPETMQGLEQLHPNLTYCEDDHARRSFSTAFPTCPDCDGFARPAVLMFDDWQWKCPKESYFQEFKRACIGYLAGGDTLRLAIVEVGAGDRIPTVRHNSENLIQQLYEHAQLWQDPRDETSLPKAKLIRINPDFPTICRTQYKHLDPYVISIPMGGLAALQAIDEAMKKS